MSAKIGANAWNNYGYEPSLFFGISVSLAVGSTDSNHGAQEQQAYHKCAKRNLCVSNVKLCRGFGKTMSN